MKTEKIVLCAFGAALTFLATVIIVLPMPGMGYVNFGDSIIYLFACTLNPLAAFFVGGVGSALADIYLGYTQFAIFTLIIKGIEGCVVAYLFHKIKTTYRVAAFVCGALIMIAGYYVTDVILLQDFIAALPSIQGNLVQGGVCVIFALLAYQPFVRIANKYKKD
ncbi:MULTISPECIES: ECF transporter S component [Breznakia]|uniref:Putative membrane protein n=1 Tax=Breznakia blatticola TaxID=1754012 RepID=A0A4R8A6S2_9FIRM|nr:MULTISPECIES: ECF transporter S component [Breznakia]MDH6366782.1 putative membrane protein [Breznakia sp. PH1-1]MDH6403831.1 putative membrane protein [Breznakia sp. PF1-11]MDH6411540.1 putative membrane protein [Breznakia sp. PFB1-11]MDH6413904.1 putative membrane protein [Breznakia sp. PFB1-14]MDH6416333.1 putative membrane protein [Breznakia sp. PFB1-4]